MIGCESLYYDIDTLQITRTTYTEGRCINVIGCVYVIGCVPRCEKGYIYYIV